MPDQQNPDQGTVGEQWSSTFQQCLDLLRGPGDERRFVGLLLVTRLLPQGSDDAVRRVLEALGMQFIHRLLLPLRRPAQGNAAQTVQGDAFQQQQQQAATGCGLALAILAAACRLPEVAVGPDVRGLLPVLLRVVRHGGPSTILQPASPGDKVAAPGAIAAEAAAARASDPRALSAADAAAVSDSLECLVAAAAAAQLSDAGALEAAEVLEALACWLTTAAAVLTTSCAPASETCRPAAVAATQPAAADVQVKAEAQVHNGTLLAASLLERLLAGGRGRPAALLAENPAAAAQIMAALAAFIGNPRLLQPPPPPPATMQPAHTDASGGGAAQLQLEALHLLLLVMRACLEPGGATAAAALVQLEAQIGWSAAVRRGLGWLLRSRVPGPLKQTALQLAACVVELAGEGWLLGRAAGSAVTVTPKATGGGGGDGRGAGQERPEAFLQLLAETLKIEIGLLLQDALHPQRRVPGGESLRSSALGRHAPPQPSQRLLDELAARAAQRKAAEEAAVAAAAGAASVSGGGPASGSGAGGSGGGPHHPQRVLVPGGAAGESAGGGALQVTGGGEGRDGLSATAAAAVAAGDSAGAEGEAAVGSAAAPEGTMLAGARALALLPACFRLQEACVEAVAADAAAADGAFMDVDVGMEGPLAAATAAGGLVMSEASMQRLMSSFDSTIDTLLQFFIAAGEQRRCPQPPALAACATASGAGGAPSAECVSQEVLLGAARVLGRYLAEAPGALCSERVLQVIPLVVAVRIGTAGGDGARAATGGAGAIGGEMDVEVEVEVEPRGRRGEEEDVEEQQEFALPYLLPGLLQATGPGADGRSETIKSLRASSAVLDACVLFLGHCVRRAAAAVPTLERQLSRAPVAGSAAAGGPTATGGSAAHAEVLRAERGLADVSMLLLNLLEPAALARQAATASASEGPTAGRQGNAAEPAESWAALTGSPADARGMLSWGDKCDAIATAATTNAITTATAREQVEAAAAAAVRHLPPLLSQLVPVCWLVSCWAASRVKALQALHSLDLLSSPGCAAAPHLARWQLSPRTLLCAACLCTVTLAATMRCLADGAVNQPGAPSQAPVPAAPAPPPAFVSSTARMMTHSAQQEQARDVGAAARAILPPAVVELSCATALAAAASGTSLELQQLRQAERQAAACAPTNLGGGPGENINNVGKNRDVGEKQSSGEVPGEGTDVEMDEVECEAGPAGAATSHGVQLLTATAVLADYPGDGNVAWERLLGACAQLVELSGEARQLAHGSEWLRRLVATKVVEVCLKEEAVRALLLDVNLALLLQVVAANEYSG